MTLQLTGQSEPRGSYQDFFGSPLQQMPLLIDHGLEPISVAGAIGRRESAPADVVDGWRRNYIFTGDGAAYDGRKNAKLVLDAALLRKINPNTKLTNGAKILSNDQLEELHGDDVLYLSADKVNQAHKKGFVKRNGVWQPENTVVGEIWEYLSRGKDLKDYAEMVHKVSRSDKVMRLWFDRSNYDSPVMRSFVLSRVGNNSDADGDDDLNYYYGRLVGVVAPEAQDNTHQRAARNGGPYRTPASVPRLELEVVLDEFKLADVAELRKALELYSTAKNIIGGK